MRIHGVQLFGQKRVLVRAKRVMTMTSDLGTIDQGGVVVVPGKDGRPAIRAVGRAGELVRTYDVPILDCQDTCLIPGLINCHTHLELSHFSGQTCFYAGFTAWAESLYSLMRTRPKRTDIARALTRMRETGTVLAADMGGYDALLMAEILNKDPQTDVLFMIQRMGFARPQGSSLRSNAFVRDLADRYLPGRRFAYAGHALYSTHPKTLQLTKAWCEHNHVPFAMHLAESSDEVELIRDGTGPLAAVLRRSRLLPGWFGATGMTPVAYAHDLGLLGPGTLAIHCVHLTKEDIKCLASTQTAVCLCPCSNAFIGVGTAPVAALRQAGVRLCLGTDGLTSNTDLDLSREMEMMQTMVPDLSLEEILRMATVNAANVLGVDNEYGRIEPGKRACLAVVEES